MRKSSIYGEIPQKFKLCSNIIFGVVIYKWALLPWHCHMICENHKNLTRQVVIIRLWSFNISAIDHSIILPYARIVNKAHHQSCRCNIVDSCKKTHSPKMHLIFMTLCTLVMICSGNPSFKLICILYIYNIHIIYICMYYIPAIPLINYTVP